MQGMQKAKSKLCNYLKKSWCLLSCLILSICRSVNAFQILLYGTAKKDPFLKLKWDCVFKLQMYFIRKQFLSFPLYKTKKASKAGFCWAMPPNKIEEDKNLQRRNGVFSTLFERGSFKGTTVLDPGSEGGPCQWSLEVVRIWSCIGLHSIRSWFHFIWWYTDTGKRNGENSPREERGCSR